MAQFDESKVINALHPEKAEAEESFTKHITEDSYFFRKAKINIYKQGYKDGLAKGKKTEADKIFDEWCSGSHDEPQECGFLKQLKEQIEKMKCCGNCKHHYWKYGEFLDCRLNCSNDTNCSKWELKDD